MKKRTSSTPKPRTARALSLELRKYDRLDVRFTDHTGADLYLFTLQREETASVSFLNLKQNGGWVGCKLDVLKGRRAKTGTAEVKMPKNEAFAVTFTIDGKLRFVVQIDDVGDSAAWFTAFDAAGNELSALCIAKPRKGGTE
jgi:hypothetical protein